MAEYVQQNLEGMLPELEEMERMGVFSRDEIKLIIRKRRDFEYRLQKRIVQKTDFLRYMQYEINLDMLKKKRKMKLGMKRNMYGEYAVMKRIHSLFQNALKKFVGDTKLWIQYIEFCKHMKSTRVLGKVFARVLQFHPNNPSLWIMAAKWEFEENRNIPNSRSLLQRGLRMNPTSQQLWLEYFRMELLHMEKIRKRQQTLRISAEEDQIEESVTDEFLAGKVPEIVYQKAIQCIPDDVKFRLSFIQIYRLFDNTKEGCDKVYESMIKDFPTSEEAWNAIACRSVEKAKAEARKSGTAISDNRWCELESEMNKLFDKAVATVPTDKMWEFYIIAYMKLLNDSSQVQAKRRVRHVLHLFSLADGTNLLTEDLYHTWVSFLLQIQEPKQALSVCEKGVRLFKKSVTLWSEYLRLQVLNQGPLEEVHNEFSTALKSVDAEESLGLWNQWLEWCITCNTPAIESVFKLSFSSCPEVSLSMKEKYLEWTLTTSGIKKARKLYKRLSLLRPTSVSFFRKCIDLELNQVSLGIHRARDLYESAIGLFGTSHPELWLDLIRLELNHPRGNPNAAGELYWRAMKLLSGGLTAEFVTQFSLLQAGRVG